MRAVFCYCGCFTSFFGGFALINNLFLLAIFKFVDLFCSFFSECLLSTLDADVFLRDDFPRVDVAALVN